MNAVCSCDLSLASITLPHQSCHSRRQKPQRVLADGSRRVFLSRDTSCRAQRQTSESALFKSRDSTPRFHLVSKRCSIICPLSSRHTCKQPIHLGLRQILALLSRHSRNAHIRSTPPGAMSALPPTRRAERDHLHPRIDGRHTHHGPNHRPSNPISIYKETMFGSAPTPNLSKDQHGSQF